MTYPVLPPSLYEIVGRINNRLDKLELGPSGAQDTADAASAAASSASATAVAAQTTATGAQTTANGKNTVHYSTSVPGTTANIAGDIWWQYTTGGVIIGQWAGAGGTSWTTAPIGNLVIANIDAGKITTGILDATLVTVTTSATASNSITFSGANTSIDFKVSGSYIGHIIPLSSAGIIAHYGALADPGGNTYPQMKIISTSASINGSVSNYFASTSTGNSIFGGLAVYNMPTAPITGVASDVYRSVTVNNVSGTLQLGYGVYYASGGDPTVTNPTGSQVGDIYFSY